jgi:phenylalanyl-tRNA synthetase beta chain
VARAVAVAVEVEPAADHAPWHPGRCARIVLTDGTLVGYAGELHPKALTALGLPARTVALELDVEQLTRASEATTRYHEISTFPAALTDVALVVSDTVTAAEVERSLRRGAGDLLEEVALFDAYAGEQVGDGRTSLAYRLTFRAPDRTLTTEEVNEFRDAAVASAGEAVGAVQRT